MKDYEHRKDKIINNLQLALKLCDDGDHTSFTTEEYEEMRNFLESLRSNSAGTEPKWKDEIKVQNNDIKWRKRSEKGCDGEMGMCQMQGVGYVVYTGTHYIPWEELEKLPRE